MASRQRFSGQLAQDWYRKYWRDSGCKYNRLPKCGWRYIVLISRSERLWDHIRPSVPSFGYCFSSIFRWHTETGNIWTHLIGGLIFIGLTCYYLLLPNMRFVAPFEEKCVFALFFLSAILCLIFSTLFHTLGKCVFVEKYRDSRKYRDYRKYQYYPGYWDCRISRMSKLFESLPVTDFAHNTMFIQVVIHRKFFIYSESWTTAGLHC